MYVCVRSSAINTVLENQSHVNTEPHKTSGEGVVTTQCDVALRRLMRPQVCPDDVVVFGVAVTEGEAGQEIKNG